MKQAELATKLAEDHNITKALATHIVNNIGVILMDDLLANGRTSCFGLGHLVKVKLAERTV
jgi:nucleoid DNA-binding protein